MMKTSRSVLQFCVLFSFIGWSASFSNAASPPPSEPVTLKGAQNGLRFEIQALTSDRARGFFIGRDFPTKQADFAAQQGCVFRSAMGHAGKDKNDPPTSIDLKKWRIVVAGQKSWQKMRTRQDWEKIWHQRKLAATPRLGFYWALFPSKQTYHAGDYNWGFLTFALPPQTVFDLTLIWQYKGKQQETVLKGLKCGG